MNEQPPLVIRSKHLMSSLACKSSHEHQLQGATPAGVGAGPQDDSLWYILVFAHVGCQMSRFDCAESRKQVEEMRAHDADAKFVVLNFELLGTEGCSIRLLAR